MIYVSFLPQFFNAISHDFSSQNFMYCYFSSCPLVLSRLISVDKCMVRRFVKMGVVGVG